MMVKRIYPKKTKAQVAQVVDMLKKGQPVVEIAVATGLEPEQILRHQSHLTRGTYGLDISDTKGVVEAVKASVSLEKDLQRALRANIDQIERGLTIIDGDNEHTVQSGRIDILAQDSDGLVVVIELKAGTADRDAVAQILSYMGDIDDNKRSARGIVVAGDFKHAAISAAKAAGRIRLLKYAFKFSFKAVKV